MIRHTLVRNLPTRIACRMRAGLFAALAVGLTGNALAQMKPRVIPPPPKRANTQPAHQAPEQAPAPAARPAEPPTTAGPATPAGNTPLVNLGHPAQTQMHLAEWMEAHKNLPLARQQQALENEPGFRDYAPEEQQRMHQQLKQLNQMSPDKRARRLAFTEEMEKLTPRQRQQVRGVVDQLGGLPEDRQHAVHRAYLQIRDLPEGQRQAYMNSPQFHAQFSDQERAITGNLVNAAPLLRPLEPPPSVPKD